MKAVAITIAQLVWSFGTVWFGYILYSCSYQIFRKDIEHNQETDEKFLHTAIGAGFFCVFSFFCLLLVTSWR